MGRDYIIYQQGLDLISSTDIAGAASIESRVNQAIEKKIRVKQEIEKKLASGQISVLDRTKMEEKLVPSPIPLLSRTDIGEQLARLTKAGAYEHWHQVPDRFEYTKRLDGILKREGTAPRWLVIKKGESNGNIDMANEDFMLFIAYYAAGVLPPEELWNTQKFGFEKTSTFIATVSAYIRQKVMGSKPLGVAANSYSWNRARANEEIVCNAGFADDSNLLLTQVDLSPHSTRDPFNNFTFIRPLTNADTASITVNSKSELLLLATLVKYAHQLYPDQPHLLPSTFTNSGREILFGDHPVALDGQMIPLFRNRQQDIPRIDSSGNVSSNTTHLLETPMGNPCGFYIGSNYELFLCRQQKSASVTVKRKPIMRFLHTEIDHLVRGLFRQAAVHTDKTIMKDLVNAMGHRFSPDYKA